MMSISTMYKSFFPLLAIFSCVVFHHEAHARTPTDSRFFCGGVAGYHVRDGYIDFGDGRTEQIIRNPLHTFGFVYGKNFRLPAGLRLQVPLQFEYGSVKEWTISDQQVTIKQKYTVITDIDLYSVFYLAGCRPLVQVPIRLTENTWAYCGAGGGVHYVIFTEEGRKDNVPYDDKKQNIRMGVDDFDYLENDRHVALSVSVAGGLEMLIRRKHLIGFHYSAIYWEPVNRKTSRDLFILYPKPLHERFLTHTFSLVYYFSLHGR